MNPQKFDTTKLHLAADDAGEAVYLVTAPGEAHPIAEIDCNVNEPGEVATRIAACVNACHGLSLPDDVKPGALAGVAAVLQKWHNWIASGQLAFTQDHLAESHALLRSLGLPAMGPVDLAFGGTIGDAQNPAPVSPQPRTIREWLETLPPGYRERALKNMEHSSSGRAELNMWDALDQAFVWGDSPEGLGFWEDVSLYFDTETPLPELPTT